MMQTISKLDEILHTAEDKAIREGYDQIIFKTKNNGYEVRRSTNCNVKKSKIVGYIRLIYRDNILSTKMVTPMMSNNM